MLAKSIAARRLARARPHVHARARDCGESPRSTYVICTNPRSGSWLLSEGIGASGRAGKPREWFNVREEQAYRAQWRIGHASDLSYRQYLAQVRTASTTTNGVCGLKLHYYQYCELPEKVASMGGRRGLTAAQCMARLFPDAKYIWLSRLDKVRQAVSLFIAASTDEWWSIDGVTPEKHRAGTGALEFDPSRIATLEQQLVANEAGWLRFFADHGAEPLVVQYEDLLVDYRGTIARTLEWLGVADTSSLDIPPPRLRRQSNERNEDWVARYTACSKSGVLHAPAPADVSCHSMLECNSSNGAPVTGAWRQWVAQSKLMGCSDEEIASVLTCNGIGRPAALAEVSTASHHPYLIGSARIYEPLRKARAFLRVQGELARLSSGAMHIERLDAPAVDEFRDSYYAANRPLILTNLMNDWPALRRWSSQYLKQRVGNAVVEVMTGRSANPNYEREIEKHRTQMPFARYVDMVDSGQATNDYYMVANNRFLQRPGAKTLLDELQALPEYLDPSLLDESCFLWFGPAGTMTPLHHDACNILLVQVSGRKRCRLIPPSQSHCVYNTCGVYSDVDCENPDLERHPAFRHATMIDTVLSPGEALFLPVGWWHSMRTLDVSLSVSFTNFRFPNRFEWEHPL